MASLLNTSTRRIDLLHHVPFAHFSPFRHLAISQVSLPPVSGPSPVVPSSPPAPPTSTGSGSSAVTDDSRAWVVDRQFKLWDTKERHEVKEAQYATSTDSRGFIPVFEYPLRGQTILVDSETGYILITAIWKALGRHKADVVKLNGSQPEIAPLVRKVRGGQLTIQGTWLPFEIAETLAKRVAWETKDDLMPLFGPSFPFSCLSPSSPGFGSLTLSALPSSSSTPDANTGHIPGIRRRRDPKKVAEAKAEAIAAQSNPERETSKQAKAGRELASAVAARVEMQARGGRGGEEGEVEGLFLPPKEDEVMEVQEERLAVKAEEEQEELVVPEPGPELWGEMALDHEGEGGAHDGPTPTQEDEEFVDAVEAFEEPEDAEEGLELDESGTSPAPANPLYLTQPAPSPSSLLHPDIDLVSLSPDDKDDELEAGTPPLPPSLPLPSAVNEQQPKPTLHVQRAAGSPSYVNFALLEDAVTARDWLHGTAFLGPATGALRIEYSPRRLSLTPAAPGTSTAAKTPPVTFAEAPAHAKPTKASPTKALWIGSVPANTTREELVAVFSQFGVVESAFVMWQGKCAFVHFARLDIAIVARKALNGTAFLGADMGALPVNYARERGASAAAVSTSTSPAAVPPPPSVAARRLPSSLQRPLLPHPPFSPDLHLQSDLFLLPSLVALLPLSSLPILTLILTLARTVRPPSPTLPRTRPLLHLALRRRLAPLPTFAVLRIIASLPVLDSSSSSSTKPVNPPAPLPLLLLLLLLVFEPVNPARLPPPLPPPQPHQQSPVALVDRLAPNSGSAPPTAGGGTKGGSKTPPTSGGPNTQKQKKKPDAPPVSGLASLKARLSGDGGSGGGGDGGGKGAGGGGGGEGGGGKTLLSRLG
ncbi:hypothetical protein JCM8547_005071 [Rhodosporidiobolus lusitaniae]